MQPLRNTSRDYSLIRSGTRRDARFSPERLSPNSTGSPCYSATRTNDVRRASLITHERCMTPGSPYYGESHSQRRGSFSHSRRSDPTPGRPQDSTSAEYPFPSRNSARSYEDDYRSSHERYSRTLARSQFRPGSPGRSDRRSSGLGHSLDRGYRRAAADYSSFPREDQYKPPSRPDRPAAMQSSNGSNHIPLSDRCGGPSPGRRHDSSDDRRRSRSLSPPGGSHSGRKPLPFGESSGDGRRQPVYRGEVGRSSKIDNEPRLPHERRLSQPYNPREDASVSRETTSSMVNSRGNLRNVVERDPNVGGLLPLPGGTLDEQPASPFASRDAIAISVPTDSGQASHTRLKEQPQSSVHVGKTRPANHSPVAVLLGAGTKHAVNASIEPRPVPSAAQGAASHIAQSNSQTGKATGSPVPAPPGHSTDSRAMSMVRESAGTGRLSQSFAAPSTAVGVKDDVLGSGSNMLEVSDGTDKAGTVPTGTKGVSGFLSVTAVPVESAPPENNQVIQKIDTRVSRWSFPDVQSAAKNSLESGEASSRGQSVKVVHETSVQQQLSQKKQTPAKQHQQPMQQNHSGQQQQLPKDDLLKQGQMLQQQQKRPLISPRKHLPESQQQPLAKKQLQSGQSLSAGDCKVSETERALSALDSPSGVVGCGPSARDVSSGAGNATAGRTVANGESVLRHGTASSAEAASLGDNLMKQKNDPRVSHWSLPGAQPGFLACQENAEVVSPGQQAGTLPEGKVMHKLQHQPLSQKHQISAKQHPLPKQQDQPGQQQLPSKDSLHKQGQPPKQQPNQQLLLKPQTPQQLPKQQLQLGQQLPQKRQPQLVLQPKKATAAGAVRPALGHNAGLSTDPVKVSESQLAASTTAAPATVNLQLGLFGSIPPLHEVSCGTASEPANSTSLSEVALTGASLVKEDNSARASRWFVESPANREVRSPGFLSSARSNDVGKLQQQQEQLPNLLNLQGKQQHSEQQHQRAQDQSQQLGRQPKQQQWGQLQVKPKQQQYLGQQQQQRQVQQMQPRITVAGPSPPLLPLPSQCNGGGLLPLPTMQAAVTIASPFGPHAGVVPMAVPVFSTSVTPRGNFQPKQIWQQSRHAAVGHVPVLRNVFSNRQQVSYGDLPDLSLCRAVSHAAVAAVASTACSTATSTASVAVGAAMTTDSVAADGDSDTAAIAGAAATVGAIATLDVTTTSAAGASIGGATVAKAGAAAAIGNVTTATVSQAHREYSALTTPLNNVPAVQKLSCAVTTSACGLFSCSTSPQSVAAAGGLVHSNVSATSENDRTLFSPSVHPVSSEPAAVSGLQPAVPADGTAKVLGTDEDAAAGLSSNDVEKASSADIPLNCASSARSPKETVFQSVSESKAAPDQESNATFARKDEMVSKTSAGELLSPFLEHHIEAGKSEVNYPSSSKIVRAAEVLLTGKAEAQETGPCQLSVSGGALPLPTVPVVEGTKSKDSPNFEVTAEAAISVPERQSVQGDTSAITTPSSPSVKQNAVGVSVRTAHVKPMRKFSTLVVDSCSVESPAACDSMVAVSSDAGAESQSELKTTGTSKESLVCKTVVCAEVLSVTSSSASSTSANSSSSEGTSAPGCSVRQELKTHSEGDPTVFAPHLDLMCSKDKYRHAEMIEPAGFATNRDGEVGSAPGEPELSSSFLFTCNDLGNSSPSSLIPKELAKTVGTEPFSSSTTVVALPLLSTGSETDSNSLGISVLALPHASMSGMKRVLENTSDEESSKTPSKHRRKEMDKKISDDKKCEGKCSQALEKQDMDSSEAVVSAQLDTLSNQDHAGCQDTIVHANKPDSGDALDHVPVAGAILSRPTVSSDLIRDVSSANSIMPGLLDKEIGRAIPEQGDNDAVILSDSRLKELLLAHLQRFIESGEGPFAAVKEARDAALRYYNSFRERFQKMSADLERACARLSEPPQVVEVQHSASELDVVSTQRTRPRLRTVGTQIRTCQFPQTGGPPTTVAVCAMCSTRFHIKNSLLPTSSSMQGSRNSLDTHGVVDLTVDEMPVSPSKNVPPVQSNEAKHVTSRDPDVPYVAPSITSLTTEPHSPAFVSAVTVSSGSNSVVTTSTFAVAGATTTSVSTLTAAVSLQANNALGVRCDLAINGEHSGAAGVSGDFCDKRKLPVGRSLAPRSVLNTVGNSVTAKVIPAQLLPAGLSMLSTSAGVRPPAAGLPGSNIIPAAEMATGKPPSKASRLDVSEGDGYTLAALAKPTGSSNNAPLAIASRGSLAHSLSEKTSMINSASSVASSKGAYLPADNPEDVTPMLTAQLGTENVALAVPITRTAPIDSRLEASGKTLNSDESRDKPSVGDRSVHYGVCEPQQQSSEKAVLSKESESEKRQQESQPLIVQELPKQPGNAVVSQQHVASKLSDKAESSTSVMASSGSTVVKCPPPLPSDSDWEQAGNGHDGGRPPSPNLEAKWTSDGLELKWNMDLTSCPNTIVKYEVYACKDDVQGLVPWTKIGIIAALPLPMSCCLNHLKRSAVYYFAVRGVDSEGVVGVFSSPRTVLRCE